MVTHNDGLTSSADLSPAALSEASPLSRDAIIEEGLSLNPKLALSKHNGEQFAKCTTKVFTRLLLPDGSTVDLRRDANGRMGCVYSRVSTLAQRSKPTSKSTANGDGNRNEATQRTKSAVTSSQSIKPDGSEFGIDLDQNADVESREEMRDKLQDTAYSEKEQIERGVDYVIDAGQAFFIASDAGLSGGWPWLDRNLMHDLYTEKAIRYNKIYRKLILDNPKY